MCCCAARSLPFVRTSKSHEEGFPASRQRHGCFLDRRLAHHCWSSVCLLCCPALRTAMLTATSCIATFCAQAWFLAIWLCCTTSSCSRFAPGSDRLPKLASTMLLLQQVQNNVSIITHRRTAPRSTDRHVSQPVQHAVDAQAKSDAVPADTGAAARAVLQTLVACPATSSVVPLLTALCCLPGLASSRSRSRCVRATGTCGCRLALLST